MSEKEVMNPLLLRASKAGHRWFRQNVGLGWVGKSERFSHAATVRVNPGDVVIRAARPLHAGLCVGSGDIIGLTRRVVTPAMIGSTVGLFTSAEIKNGRTGTTKEQHAFREMVQEAGGIAGIIRTVEEGEALFDPPAALL